MDSITTFARCFELILIPADITCPGTIGGALDIDDLDFWQKPLTDLTNRKRTCKTNRSIGSPTKPAPSELWYCADERRDT